MSREIEFDKNANCDSCGTKGAYDFLGDFFCHECTINQQRTTNNQQPLILDKMPPENEILKTQIAQLMDMKETNPEITGPLETIITHMKGKLRNTSFCRVRQNQNQLSA